MGFCPPKGSKTPCRGSEFYRPAYLLLQRQGCSRRHSEQCLEGAPQVSPNDLHIVIIIIIIKITIIMITMIMFLGQVESVKGHEFIIIFK